MSQKPRPNEEVAKMPSKENIPQGEDWEDVLSRVEREQAERARLGL